MLRINLLPIRQLKKQAKARNQIVLGCFVFVCVLVALALIGVLQAARISSLNEDIAAKEREVRSFDKVIKELAELEKKRIDLNHKISIINQLKTDSSLAVRVLDEVARLTDSDRIWLTSLNHRGGSLTLAGYALDNETIAQYMDELKFKSPFINSVTLSNASLSPVSGRDLKSFSLNCSVAVPSEQGAAEQETDVAKQ